MLRQNRYPPPKSLLFRGLHPVFVVYSIVFMSIHYLMRLITQLRANIPLCAAKQMQIESRTCQACLGNYAEMQLCFCKDTNFLKQMSKCSDYFLYLQQFNVFSRLSAIIPPIISCESKEIPHIMQANFVNASIHFAVRPRTCP